MVYVGYATAHGEDLGQIPTQGGPHIDGTATSEGTVWDVVLNPTGGGDGRGWPTNCGELHRPMPEHSHRVNCDQAHYGPVTGGRATPGDKVV